MSSKKEKRERTIQRTHEIEDQAINYLNSKLPPSWLKRKQDPDIFLDYSIEIVEKGEPTGKIFFIQLKGTDSSFRKKRRISFPLKSKHLKYYLDKMRLPVFLVYINVKEKIGYWQFVQKWVKENRLEDSWRNQNTISVPLPKENKLENSSLLYNAVIDALVYMRNLWPGEIDAAITKHMEKIRSIDPRLQVNLDITEGQKRYVIFAKEPLDLKIVGGDKNRNITAEKIQKFMLYGKKFTLYDEEFTIEGSPLYDKLFKTHLNRELVLKPAKKLQGTLLLEFPVENFVKSFEINGELTSGLKAIRFFGELPCSPMAFEVILPHPHSKVISNATFATIWDPEIWGGKHLLGLPFFDQIYSILNAQISKLDIQYKILVQGNEFFSGSGGWNENVPEDTLAIFEFLKKLNQGRKVFKDFKINPKLPKIRNITYSDFDNIDTVHALINGDEHQTPGEGFRMNVTIKINSEYRERLIRGERMEGAAQLSAYEYEFGIFGKSVKIRNVQFTLVPARAYISEDELCKLKLNTSEPIKMEWIGQEKAQLCIKKFVNWQEVGREGTLL